MREFHGAATAFIDAQPEAIFDVIVDVDRSPVRPCVEANRGDLRIVCRSPLERSSWQITPVDGGAQVTVQWHATTRLLRRRRVLANGITESLELINQLVSRRSVH